MLCNFTI